MTKKPSILLVEDDSFLIDIYQKKLESSGFKLKIAEKGDIALEMLAKEKPDLVLLDIVLPNIGGWEILRKLKKDKQFANLKIIILSNLGQKEEVEKGLGLGVEKYLIKAQFTPAQVVEQVKETLGV